MASWTYHMEQPVRQGVHSADIRPVVTLKRLPYPGTPLTVGSSGSAVLYYSLLLQRIAYYLPVWRTRPSPTSTPTRLPPPPAAHRSCWAYPRPALRMPTHGQLWKR